MMPIGQLDAYAHMCGIWRKFTNLSWKNYSVSNEKCFYETHKCLQILSHLKKLYWFKWRANFPVEGVIPLTFFTLFTMSLPFVQAYLPQWMSIKAQNNQQYLYNPSATMIIKYCLISYSYGSAPLKCQAFKLSCLFFNKSILFIIFLLGILLELPLHFFPILTMTSPLQVLCLFRFSHQK